MEKGLPPNRRRLWSRFERLSPCRHNPPGLSGHHQFLLGVNDNTVHQARTNAGISHSEAPPSRSAGMLPAYTTSVKPDGSRILRANGCVHNGCVHFTVKNPRHGVALRSTFSPFPSNSYELMLFMAFRRSAARAGGRMAR